MIRKIGRMARMAMDRGSGWLGHPNSFDLFRAPYPTHYERWVFVKDGSLVLTRPIKPQDAALLVKLFQELSPASVYFRFLSNVRSLPEEWVHHFTRIEYDRDVAMVAVRRSKGEERILGVGRIMRSPGSTRGEVAVVVADAWQGKGIGTVLLKTCIRIAEELGMRSLWGLVSLDNERIITMAAKLGFTRKPQCGEGLLELEMTLDTGSR